MARPTKLNPAVQKQIVDRLTAGAYFETAVVSAGISKNSGHAWVSRGRDALANLEEHKREDGSEMSREELEAAVPDSERIFVRFFHAVEEASANAEVGALAQLRRGERGWQAQAWFLERRFSERWRRRQEFFVQPGNTEETQQRDTLAQIREDLSGEDLEALESEIRAALKSQPDQ